MLEVVDQRILAGLRFVDATVGTAVTTPLEITGDRVRLIRNRSGLYVLTEAPGFAAYTAGFRDPPAVNSAAVTLTVCDPLRKYLPRAVTIMLPRSREPKDVDAVWKPIDVALHRSPTGGVGVGWAALRLSICRKGTKDGLPFAYVRVVRVSDTTLLASGLADHRGEALVPVAGIPVTSWNTTSTASSPTVSSVPVLVTAYFDSAAFDEEAGRYPDPALLEQRRANFPKSDEVSFNLASGHEETRRIDVALP